MTDFWKRWHPRVMTFMAIVLIVAVIGLTIQIQKRNHTVDKINHTSNQVSDSVKDIQQIVNDFKIQAKKQNSNAVDSRAVKEGLEDIKQIKEKIDILLERIK